MDTEDVLAAAKENMSKVYHSFESGVGDIILPVKNLHKDGRYRPLSCGVDWEEKKGTALSLIAELQWVIEVQLHNIRCLSETAIEEILAGDSSADQEVSAKTEELRKICLEYRTRIRERVGKILREYLGA